MVTKDELVAAVDAAFAGMRRGLVIWPDPHGGREPLDDEYTRVTDAGRWRILGRRADAWIVALADAGLAVVERDAVVEWREAPGSRISRTDRLVPSAPGSMPLVVARSRIGDADDAGVTLGVGHPAVGAGLIPACGCDACDGGAQPELDLVDVAMLAVVGGTFRRLSKGDSAITVFRDGWSAIGVPPDQVVAVLAAPDGWDEVSGASWFGDR